MSDNSWYEKGEIPPVNVQCMNGNNIVKIVAHLFNGDYKYAAFQHVDGNGCGYSQAESFYPLKTERERTIEDCISVFNAGGANDGLLRSMAGSLYDAGYRKTTPD
jgi:hypothetical protein